MRPLLRVLTLCFLIGAMGVFALWRANQSQVAAPAVPLTPVEAAPYEVITAENVRYLREMREFEHGSRGSGNHIFPVPIQSVVFSPDSRWIVTGGFDDVKIWDVKSGNLLKTLPTEPEGFDEIGFSPDHHWLAGGRSSGYGDPFLSHIWNTQTWETISLSSSYDSYRQFVFLGSDRLAVYNDENHTIEIWDLRMKSILQTLDTGLTEHWDFDRLALTPDGKHLLVNDDVWDVISWQKVDPNVLQQLPPEKACADRRDWISSLDQRFVTIYCGTPADGFVQQINQQTGQIVREWHEWMASPSHSYVVYSPAHGVFASRYQRGYVALWDSATGQLLIDPIYIGTPFMYSQYVEPLIVFDPNGSLLLLSDRNTVRVFAINRDKIDSCAIASPIQDPAQAYVKRLKESDVYQLKVVKEFLTSYTNLGLTFSQDGRFLVGKNDRGSILHIWDTQTGQLVFSTTQNDVPDQQTINIRYEPVMSQVAASVTAEITYDFSVPSSPHIYNDSHTYKLIDGEIIVYDLAGVEVTRFGEHINKVEVSPSRELIVTSSGEYPGEFLSVWATGDFDEYGIYEIYRVRSDTRSTVDIAFRPDGRYFARSAIDFGSSTGNPSFQIWGLCDP